MTQNQDKTNELLISEILDLRRQLDQLQTADTDQRKREQIERQLLETTCKQTEDKLQAILTNIEGGYFEVDLSGTFVFCNAAASLVFGYSPEELAGTNYRLYTSEVTARRLFQLFNKVYRDRQPAKEFAYEIIGENGIVRSVSMAISLIIDEAGQSIGFRGVINDVTERKRVEDELRLMQFLIEHAVEAVFWLSGDLRFVYVNRASCQMLGYTREELLRMHLSDIDPWFPVAKWPRIWEEMKQGTALTFPSQHRRKEGRVIPVEVSSSYLPLTGEEYSCSYARDITRRKK